MSRLAKLVLPIALAISVQSAHAEMLWGRAWETNVSLTQADIDMIKTTLAQKIHGHAVGTSASWSDPTSGNSGTLALLQVFFRQAQRCEQIAYRISPEGNGPSDHYVLMSCLQPDGTWKLSD